MSEPFPVAYPHARTQAEYVAEVQRRAVSWEAIPVGYAHTWERVVTQDAIDAYADAVDDHTEWYGPDPSPFGAPIAPPLLFSQWCVETIRPLGTAAGHVNTFHRSEVFGPVRVGTRVRFTARVVEKYVKRGLRYRREVIDVTDVADGRLVFRETRDYMMGREPEGGADA